MDDFRKDKLDEKLDQELASLKEKQAPEALLQNVMQSIEQRASQPWYRRSYTEWPVVAQVAALCSLSLVGLTLYFVTSQIGQFEWLSHIADQARQLVGAVDYFITGIGKALASINRVFLGDYLLALAVLAVAINGVICTAGTYVWKRTKNIYAQNGAH